MRLSTLHTNDLPVIILLGGKGSRFSELNKPPKQLAKINKKNLIISILQYYKKYDLNYFIMPLGFKSEFFHKFFNNKNNQKKYKINILKKSDQEVKKNYINIKLFNTKKTASKLERIYISTKYFQNNFFLVTYGDGLANINFKKQLNFFKKKRNNLLTVFNSRSQYGHAILGSQNKVKKFEEKPYFFSPINIGYYILNKNDLFRFYKNRFELENDYLKILIRKGLLYAYNHNGFFFNVDNKKDLDEVKKKFKGV